MPRPLPILDLSSWREGDGASLARIAAEAGAACREAGFFYVAGHGVDPDLIAGAFEQSRGFFGLPLARKQALAIERVGGNRGYSGMLHEALDPGRGPDMKEAFNVGFEIAPDDPDLLAGQPFRSLNAWPSLPGFRETLLTYYDACAGLGARLHRAFARDLGLDPNFFAAKFDRPMATLRTPALPRCARRLAAADGRGGAHRLRQSDLARDRRRRRTRGPGPQWRMDRGACRPRRLHRQYRRLPDAVDQRHLCLHSTPRRQSERARALFDRVLL